MKGPLIKCSIVILTFTVGVSVYLPTASKYADFWKKDRQSHVYFNGQLSPGSVVYRGRNHFRVLNTAEDGAWYVLGEDGPIEYCKAFDDRSHRFFTLQLPGYLYVWHYGSYPCVGAVMLDIDPTMLVAVRSGEDRHPTSIEFNSRTRARVRVDW